MAETRKVGASHHHRMIEHHARKLREMAHKGPTKPAERKGGRVAAKDETRKKDGAFKGKRR